MNNIINSSLSDNEFDKKYLWHPYSSFKRELDSYLVDSANGAVIYLEDGTKLIDALSSWWSVCFGYNNKQINDAILNQLNKMSHVMFAGLTHKPAIDLGRKLLKILPKGLEYIFYSDSGSVSVEVAQKMALQYWKSLDPNTLKKNFFSLKFGYHGDTFAASSVTDNNLFYNSSLVHSDNIFIPEPTLGFEQEISKDYQQNVRELFEKNYKNIAGLILEPIVQGAGGMRIYSPSYLDFFRKICSEFDILLIFDEIATGFARTGKMFATDYSNSIPDIMCIGKAITGGYISLASTVCNSKVSQTISQNSALMHGPTFMANPLACSAALASLTIFEKNVWQQQLADIQQQLTAELEICKYFSNVVDVRVLGAIGAVELKHNIDVNKAQSLFFKHGVWLRPFSNIIYTMPPFIITAEQLSIITGAMIKVIKEL